MENLASFSDLQGISYMTSNNDSSSESFKDLASGHPNDAEVFLFHLPFIP